MIKNLQINEESFPFQILRKMYDWEGRFYHTISHVQSMMDFASKEPDFTIDVALAILYHDIIIITGSEENELASASFFKSMWENGLIDSLFINKEDLNSVNSDKVFDLILATKDHRFTGDPENDLLMKADLLWYYKDKNGYQLINENLIRKEFQSKSTYRYLTGRIEFLENLKKTLGEDGVLEDYIKGIDENILYLKEHFEK